MNLEVTKEFMTSSDYSERFKAEYWQTKERYNRLHRMLIKHDAGTLEFEPSCSIELLKEQASAMGKYLYIMEVRAEIEKINIEMPE